MSTTPLKHGVESQFGRELPQLKLEGKEDAFEFFSQPAFFQNQRTQGSSAIEMIDAGFKGKTVQELVDESGCKKSFLELFSNTTIDSTEVGPYYDSFHRSAEDRVASEKIIALSDDGEISRIKKHHTSLPVAQTVRDNGLKVGNTRDFPVYMVLGSSGSGKSFFAVKDLTEVNVPNEYITNKRVATLYLKPKNLDGNSRGPGGALDPESLIQWIQKQMAARYNVEFSAPLTMHLNVVLDEVGEENLGDYYEKKSNLEGICKKLEKLAVSTKLIICGTGLQGKYVSSDKEVYKFCMIEWTEDEMKAVLEVAFLPSAHIPELLRAIGTQATLSALLSNGRSAFFLGQTIMDIYMHLRFQQAIHWVDQIRERTPSIVEAVVAQYINANALSDLSRPERFHVAASVFRAIEVGRNSMDVELLTFPDLLDVQLRHCAKSLIETNVEIQGTTLQYIRCKACSSVLVSPAMVVILYTLMGVQASVLTTWRSQELMSALFEFRRRVLSVYKPYDKALQFEQDEVVQRWAEGKRCTVDDLTRSLLPGEEALLSESEQLLYNKEQCQGKKQAAAAKYPTLQLENETQPLGLVQLTKAVPEKK